MTQIRKVVALGAAVVGVALCPSLFAQDDLDDLLKDLESEATAEESAVKAEEPAAAAEEPAAEEPAAEAEAEAPAVEAEAEAEAEEPAAEAEAEAEAEEPAAEAEAEAEAEEPAAEAEAEEPAAEEPAAEAEAEEPAAEEPAAEAEAEAEEPAAEAEVEAEAEEPAAETEEPADEPAEEPAAEEPAAEEPATETKVDDALTLLDELANESNGAPAKVEEPKAEEPAAEEPAAEEPAATEEPAAEEPKAEEPAAEETEEPAAEEPAAEEPKAEEPAKPVVTKPVGPDAELLSNLVTTERVRRKALDAQANRYITEARQGMKSGEYVEAVRNYGNALKLLGDRPAVKKLRKECEQGMAEGLYRAALNENNIGRRENALKLMDKAVEMRHPRAKRMIEKWSAETGMSSAKQDLSDIRHRKNDEDYKKEREQIRKHLKRSRQYLSLRDMDKALEECEVVLVNDPYNEEAIHIRNAIEKKRKLILKKEREAAREGMIADVDQAWRPVYAVNAAQLNEQLSETIKSQTGEDPERTMEQDIERRMKEMMLPNVSFKPPATIVEAVEFFRQASKDFDRPEIPADKRGFNFVLRLPQGAYKAPVAEEDSSDDFTSNGEEEPTGPSNGLDPISTITASDISFYEALKLVCDSVQFKFIINGKVVMVMPLDMSTAELIPRKYNVPEAFVERVNNAKDEMKTMGGASFGASNRKSGNDEEEGEEQDWKAFFEEMGVKWPEGSSIKHIKALGKLYVRNTRENLAEFEKVLDELGAQTPLIEIETRFVEVSQEDLNSLGFEWLLNSDYSLNLGDSLGKALGVRDSTWGTTKGNNSVKTVNSTTYTDAGTIGSNGAVKPSWDSGTVYNNSTTVGNTFEKTVLQNSNGAGLIRQDGAGRNIGINAFGGDSDYANGNRYLSTVGNHISGQSNWTNDQFMRVNAFLGNADLSMILHMLSQRSDTDLLSAPKIVTKSGENAVIKVVTEFIYPQDYDVQLQSSSSSSGGSNGGSQSAVLAVVEPQNFTMREVGVILDVTPMYNEANGGTIDLELKPQVVDEPTWKNYGMKIPFTGNSSLQNFEGIGGIFDGLASSIGAIGEIPADIKNWIITTEVQAAEDALNGLTKSSTDNMTYYDAPMEQPFFHVRSIDSKVSITPGATVVMGGLITESRKAMDDKIPFLGDLPFIGRLFRSHAEKTLKRNLLIFVTGRLITPSGRELKMSDVHSDEAEVKAAPQAD